MWVDITDHYWSELYFLISFVYERQTFQPAYTIVYSLIPEVNQCLFNYASGQAAQEVQQVNILFIPCTFQEFNVHFGGDSQWD